MYEVKPEVVLNVVLFIHPSPFTEIVGIEPFREIVIELELIAAALNPNLAA